MQRPTPPAHEPFWASSVWFGGGFLTILKSLCQSLFLFRELLFLFLDLLFLFRELRFGYRLRIPKALSIIYCDVFIGSCLNDLGPGSKCSCLRFLRIGSNPSDLTFIFAERYRHRLVLRG